MKRKILPLLTPILFFGFLSVLLVWALVKPAGVSSGAEGRALAQKPVKDLTDLPALIERCNDYVADQFPMRETLLKLDSAAQIYTGKRLIRGITVDAEGYLLPQLYRADPAQREAMVFALDDQVQALPQVDFVYAVLPQKNTMLDSPLLDGRISKANHHALRGAAPRERSACARPRDHAHGALFAERAEGLFFPHGFPLERPRRLPRGRGACRRNAGAGAA